MSAHKDPMSIFRDVQKTFMAGLSDKDRDSFETFQDAFSMLGTVETIVKDHPIHQSTLTVCFRRIRDLARRLDPYFEILNIFVSTHPEFAALAWGAIRLVFQLGKNYAMFLEKICDMFAQMGRTLPAYEEYVERLVVSGGAKNKKKTNRILTAMAFVYSDLIHYCFDAYTIFTKKRSVLGLKWPLAATLFWRPFDDRFESVLTRFKEHKDLMDFEMRADTNEKVMHATKKLSELTSSTESQSKSLEGGLKSQQDFIVERRLEKLIGWIDPPRWLHLYEQAQGRRAPKTVDWILTDPTIQAWINGIDSAGTSLSCNVLSIKGKPGFGKTTLCTALIDHLKSKRPGQGSEADARNVVFFYFDQQSNDDRLLSVCYRAILTQLLQIHGGNRQGIDITSLLWMQNNGGQRVASDNEVKELLRLILSHTKHLVLLLDGIDECSDQQNLFRSLKDLGFNSPQYSIAFFGRPTWSLPRTGFPQVWELMLHDKQNLQDICCFLRLKIQELVDDNTLSENTDIEITVTKISNRANGMFLWVTLIIEYLASPALTMRQRRNTIENLNRLEGLDALYGLILESLSAQFEGEARENVQHLFQWVICSNRQLFLPEIVCAMAVPQDRKMEDDDDFGDLSRSLGSMSGALLELDFDNKIRFIHLSALEYFKELRPSTATGQQIAFSPFSGHTAHVYCATICLSYLYHTVPAEPLSGSAQITPDKIGQGKRFPLLEYCSEYWSQHMLEAVTTLETEEGSAELRPIQGLLDLTKSFLGSKVTISVWIEASWMFGRQPNLADGEEQMRKILTPARLALMDRGLVELFRHSLEALGQLFADLVRLNGAWGKVLRQNPNEIWEASISAFQKSKHWVAVDGSKLTPLKSKGIGNVSFICVRSQVSANGKLIGMIMVQPPQLSSGKDSCFEDSPDPQAPLEEPVWKVRYELWSVKSRKMIMRSSFDVAREKVPFSYMLGADGAATDQRTLEFLFPTSLSSNLRRASFANVTGSLVDEEAPAAVQPSRKKKMGFEMRFQEIDIALRTSPSSCGSFNFDWSRFHAGFSTQMSASGEYLLVFHMQPSNECPNIIKVDDITRASVWFVRVYRDAAFNSGQAPSYSLLSAIAFRPHRCDETKDRPFTFHPELPLLIFISARTVWIERADVQDGMAILSVKIPIREVPSVPSFQLPAGIGGLTFVWNFSRKASKPVCIGELMKDVAFSNDGAKIYGATVTKVSYGETISSKVVIDVPFDKLGIDTNETIPCQTLDEGLVVKKRTDKSSSGSQQVSLYSASSLTSLSKGPNPITQQSNSLLISRDDAGRPVVTDLQQSASQGTLVLRTLRSEEEGLSISHETLTRLPEWIDRATDATLLNLGRVGQEDADHEPGAASTRIVVLNRAARPFQAYSSGDPYFVTSILEREQQTIPKIVSRRGDLGLGLVDTYGTNKGLLDGVLSKEEGEKGACIYSYRRAE